MLSDRPIVRRARYSWAGVAVLVALGALLSTLMGCPFVSDGGNGGGGGEARGGLAPELIARLKDAVVLVEVDLVIPGVEDAGATGSGFLVSDDGVVVTNQHVVSLVQPGEAGRGAAVAQDRKVRVVFHPGTEDEKTAPAEVVRENHEVDLALLKIEGGTPFLDLADSEAAVETSKVYVCGHPLGLREFSIRSGTLTAHRVLDGRPFIEHDASGEEGSSGGPVVDTQARVLGVHKMTLFSKALLTKMAIPSKVLREWLAGNPAEDPEAPTLGQPVRALLIAGDMKFEELEGGIFALPFEGDVTVLAHQWEEFVRVYVPLGALPGSTAAEQGAVALAALRFNYQDPVGRMSVAQENGQLSLFWECQMPIGAATASPEYLPRVTVIAANQVERWAAVLAGQEAGDPEHLYPGGDDAAQFAQLETLIQAANLVYEQDEDVYKLPYEDGLEMRVSTYRGMVYTFTYTGGMPGDTEEDFGRIAIEMLKRNWDDPFGRLALDEDDDVVWESQVPLEFMTPDYLTVVAGTGAVLGQKVIEDYGDVPFRGETE